MINVVTDVWIEVTEGLSSLPQSGNSQCLPGQHFTFIYLIPRRLFKDKECLMSHCQSVLQVVVGWEVRLTQVLSFPFLQYLGQSCWVSIEDSIVKVKQRVAEIVPWLRGSCPDTRPLFFVPKHWAINQLYGFIMLCKTCWIQGLLWHAVKLVR